MCGGRFSLSLSCVTRGTCYAPHHHRHHRRRAGAGACFAHIVSRRTRTRTRTHTTHNTTKNKQQDKASADAYYSSPATLARVAALKPYLAPTGGVVTTFETNVVGILRYVN
jgi:hypothetical protein